MNRTFLTFCLSLLGGLLLPCVVLAGIFLFVHPDNAWRMLIGTLPLSTLLSLLTICLWLWGPPKPTSFMEAFGRWFLALLMPSGMAFIATAGPILLVVTVDHLQISTYQNFYIGSNVLWGLICGIGAGCVLQYREWCAPKVEEKIPAYKRSFVLNPRSM